MNERALRSVPHIKDAKGRPEGWKHSIKGSLKCNHSHLPKFVKIGLTDRSTHSIANRSHPGNDGK